MADVAIDITGEEDALAVANPLGFDLQITGCGICIDITHEQGLALYLALAEFFGPELANG